MTGKELGVSDKATQSCIVRDNNIYIYRRNFRTAAKRYGQTDNISGHLMHNALASILEVGFRVWGMRCSLVLYIFFYVYISSGASLEVNHICVLRRRVKLALLEEKRLS